MVKISVIVPVYNVEQYLNECLDSLLKQKFNDFEVILVDDGSTDSSGEICREYSLKYSNIRYLYKKNGGLSSARNFGMENSRGEWVIFIDSDDFLVSTDALSVLYDYAVKHSLDILRYEYTPVDEFGNIIEKNAVSNKVNIHDIVFNNFTMVNTAINGEWFAVLYLIRRYVIKNHRFNELRKYQEDIEFYATLFAKRQLRCGYLPYKYYAYRQRGNSLTSTPRITNIKNSFSLCEVFDNEAKRAEAFDLDLGNTYRYYSVMMYYWTLQTLSADPYYQNVKQIVRELQLEDLLLRTRERSNKVRNKLNFKVKTVLSHSPEVSAKILHYGALVSKIFK